MPWGDWYRENCKKSCGICTPPTCTEDYRCPMMVWVDDGTLYGNPTGKCGTLDFDEKCKKTCGICEEGRVSIILSI